MRVQNPPARSDWLFYHYKVLRAICQSSLPSFYGMPLPALALRHEDGAVEVVKEFGYQDFKARLS